ncbi:hypothetical protein K450DRAFT_275948 [Umbelopsis ramanniana AG]|uniref:Alginate lyase domain-containing protein n=1 Tax=Umbelopsis ramanniana AG TaxID=1314678 RepID=A0AAD5E240_UMBRA|nr:uncharacterized protein K450DRAFT_275948 [Umbelopsis ramanniana AG]KAI8575081.1 hypothetical protein K450DRAFT_275948 [Umbelopsis ramanniana AG]
MKFIPTFLALSAAVAHLAQADLIAPALTPVVPTPISFSNYTLEWKSLSTIVENAAIYRVFHAKNKGSSHGKLSVPHPVYQTLKDLADEAVAKPLYTIVNKPFLPPSGDKRDWLSYAPYWWPSPSCNATDKNNDCAFIQMDGQVNPDVYKLNDQRYLEYVSLDTETLAMASLVFDDDSYGQKATDMLRYFFLNNATRMNPNLEYGQIIRGNGKSATHIGRAEGIISARALVSPIRAVKILQLAKARAWKKNDTAGMVDWYSQFHDWLIEDKIAVDESNTKNNHLTYYTNTLTTISDFIGNYSTIESRVTAFFKDDLPGQITANGTQPLEEIRTLPFHYSAFNLEALTYMANFVSQKDPLSHGPYISNAWNQTGDSIISAVNRLIDVVRGTEGQIEPGADLSEADYSVRAVGIQYPKLYCNKYHAIQNHTVPYLNLWPLWTPRLLWDCFN